MILHQRRSKLAGGRRLISALLALSVITVAAAAKEAKPGPAARTVFIVSCRCPSAADRQRVAAAVRRTGGSIVYTYETMPGLAVISAPGADTSRFEARIRRIPEVVDVRVSGTQQLQGRPGQPASSISPSGSRPT